MNFEYQSHTIFSGKKKLQGLPATYVERDEEADTLEITLFDEITQTQLILSYTIYSHLAVITRNARFKQLGSKQIVLNRAMSMAIDFPDYDYEMIHFSGAWARERGLKVRKLDHGEADGFSLVYSGNFLAQVEVDSHNMTRVLMGIHPDMFSWKLSQEEKENDR